MAVHKRTQITIETDWGLTIRRGHSTRAWCPQCGREVDMVDLGEAEALTGMSGKALRDCAQARRWHSAEGQNGIALVCIESVRKLL